MGREWFYWGGGGGGARSSSSAASASKKGKRSRKQLEVEDDGSAPSPGCMCAVLQLFDLPHFQVVLNHHSHRSLSPVSSFVQDHPFERPTGLEAPRNSLDMEETTVGLNPGASKTMLPRLKQEDEEEEAKNLNNISVGINQIRTSCDSRPSSCKPRSDDFSSECSSSPGGAKTPNLVARLMGLDLLPENASPTFGNSRKSNLQPRTEPRDRARYLLHQDRRSRSFNVLDNADISGAGTVSLPETPRISLARKSDVDHHHRLSLQINKENVGEEFDQFSSGKRSARSRRREPREPLRQVDENIRSPSFYARQIVKQVKESVSRKVGAADITIHKNNLKKDHNLDNNQVVLLKPSKPSIFLQDNFSPTKHQSCSPRFRFLEPKPTKQPSNTDNFTHPPKPPQKVIPKPKSQENKNNLKKPAAIRSKKEEPFVRPANINHETKKGKRSELLNPNNVPTILPALKKDCRPSSSQPKLPQKQAQNDALSSKKSSPQLSSSPSQSYHHPLTTSKEKNIIVRDDRNGAAGEEEAEFQYIQRILKRTGVEKDSSVSLAKWYSSSHPLDPSIFHYIELFHHIPAIKSSKLRLRCNRKLVFQLVDELLVGILRPCIGSRVGFGRNMTGSELMETICYKVRNFPSADCQVLEDIDALIETDMEKSRIGEEEEEEERVVLEIERHVVDELMHETAMVVLEGVARGTSVRTVRDEEEVRERERERHRF